MSCSVPRGAAAAVARKLRSAIAAETTLDPPIAIRTAAQLAKVVEQCPFDDTANVHVTFLVEGAKGAAPKVDQEQFAPERYDVQGQGGLPVPPQWPRTKQARGRLEQGRGGRRRHDPQLAHRHGLLEMARA